MGCAPSHPSSATEAKEATPDVPLSPARSPSSPPLLRIEQQEHGHAVAPVPSSEDSSLRSSSAHSHSHSHSHSGLRWSTRRPSSSSSSSTLLRDCDLGVAIDVTFHAIAAALLSRKGCDPGSWGGNWSSLRSIPLAQISPVSGGYPCENSDRESSSKRIIIAKSSPIRDPSPDRFPGQAQHHSQSSSLMEPIIEIHRVRPTLVGMEGIPEEVSEGRSTSSHSPVPNERNGADDIHVLNNRFGSRDMEYESSIHEHVYDHALHPHDADGEDDEELYVTESDFTETDRGQRLAPVFVSDGTPIRSSRTPENDMRGNSGGLIGVASDYVALDGGHDRSHSAASQTVMGITRHSVQESCTGTFLRGMSFTGSDIGSDDEDFDADPEQYSLQEVTSWRRGPIIGKGSFGAVYAGLSCDDGHLLAIKEFEFLGSIETIMEHVVQLQREIMILQQLRHENIVRYRGTEREGNTLRIFLEYVAGGSIRSLLKQFGPFPENVIRIYTRHILYGLVYLHRKRIIHRDIKPANILVDKDGTCKLADFGASHQMRDLASRYGGFKSFKGTPFYMAPEIITQVGAGRSSDIWSLGCTIIEMATGLPPWADAGTQVRALLRIAESKDPPAFPQHLSRECRNFLYLCFLRDPEKRPRSKSLLQHPWFRTNLSHMSDIGSHRSIVSGPVLESVIIPADPIEHVNASPRSSIRSSPRDHQRESLFSRDSKRNSTAVRFRSPLSSNIPPRDSSVFVQEQTFVLPGSMNSIEHGSMYISPRKSDGSPVTTSIDHSVSKSSLLLDVVGDLMPSEFSQALASDGVLTSHHLSSRKDNEGKTLQERNESESLTAEDADPSLVTLRAQPAARTSAHEPSGSQSFSLHAATAGISMSSSSSSMSSSSSFDSLEGEKEHVSHQNARQEIVPAVPPVSREAVEERVQRRYHDSLKRLESPKPNLMNGQGSATLPVEKSSSRKPQADRDLNPLVKQNSRVFRSRNRSGSGASRSGPVLNVLGSSSFPFSPTNS